MPRDPLRATSRSRRAHCGFLILSVSLILATTLVPGRAADSTSAACVICGERGIADAILNVLLFAPLGIALSLSSWSGRRLYLLGALLSSSIEFVQLFIPGRDPSVGDVLFNLLGVAAGVLVTRSAARWLLPGRRQASRLSLAAAVAAVAVFALSGILLAPSFPESVYYGQWTPNLGHLEWYRGRVLAAELGPVTLPGRRLEESDSVRSLLSEGAPLRVLAIAGPRSRRLASLVSIYDVQQREIVLLGPDRDDLVYRYRTRAAALRLDQPDLRLSNAMRRVAPGDMLEIAVRRAPGGRCISLDHARACNIGFGVGSGWALLLYPEGVPVWVRMLLSAGWVAALAVPVGFWSRRQWGTVLATGVLAGGLVIVPWATALATVTVVEVLGGVVGLLGGALLHRYVRSRW